MTVTSAARTDCNKRATANKGKLLRPRIGRLEKMYSEQKFFGVWIFKYDPFATLGGRRFLRGPVIDCTLQDLCEYPANPLHENGRGVVGSAWAVRYNAAYCSSTHVIHMRSEPAASERLV